MLPDPILRSFELLHLRSPLAPLLVSPSHRATVEEVDALSRAALAALPADLAPGTMIGLWADNGPGFLASLLALRRRGYAALLLDGKAPVAEALRVAAALGAAALLGCRRGWPTGPSDWELLATGVPDPCELPETAVVKLTSGSTGTPRGIATPAEALLADDAALTATMGLDATDRFLTVIPLSHSYGLSSLAVPALVRGTLLVLPDEGGVPDPFAAAAAAGATFFPAVPAYLDALLRCPERHPVPPSLRRVITAGAPLSAETSARFRAATGLAVHVFYGASECGGICFDREGGAAERGTVGEPVEGVELCFADPAGGERAGVVTVRGAAVAAGYVPDGDARLAGGVFIASDFGMLRHGELVLLGRIDDLVNIRGKKVNPREVEAVLGQIPGVEEAAVFGIPIPHRTDELLRAVVVCQPGSLSVEDVRSFCREQLAAHKVPRSIILVPEMPRTARGKLDRGALLALSAARGQARDEHA